MRDHIDTLSLVRYLDAAVKSLNQEGEEDAALRFELFADYLRKDYTGGPLVYKSIQLGL